MRGELRAIRRGLQALKAVIPTPPPWPPTPGTMAHHFYTVLGRPAEPMGYMAMYLAAARAILSREGLMKHIDTIRRDLVALHTKAHAGHHAVTLPDGSKHWLDGREAITVLFEVIKAARDHGGPTTLADLPEELSQKVRLWSMIEPREGDGQIYNMVKIECKKIVDRGHCHEVIASQM